MRARSWRGTSAAAAMVLALCAAVAGRAQPAVACSGDCDRDGTVAINELVLGVTIALGNAPVSRCDALDTNSSGAVEIAELVAAVVNALTSCPTPTPTSIASVPVARTPTATPHVSEAPTATPAATTTHPVIPPSPTPLPGASWTVSPSASTTPTRTASTTRSRTPSATATITPTLPAAVPVLIAGPQFVVNSFTTGSQADPAVCTDSGGRFVVTWASGDRGIRGQRYATDGGRLGQEFAVGMRSSPAPSAPSVDCAADGSFVAVWQDGDADGAGIAARRFGSDGAPLGEPFAVNTYTTADQTLPDVCGGDAGSFTIVWQSAGQDGSQSGVFARRYDSTGSAPAAEFQLSTATTNEQQQPSIACDATGAAVAVWSDRRSGSVEIVGRSLTSATLGDEFFNGPIGPYTNLTPDVARSAAGEFVVAWEAYRQVPDLDVPQRVVARRYDSSGTGLDPLLNVGFQLGRTQGAPALARRGDDFVAAWVGGEVPICKPGAFCFTGMCGDSAFPVCRDARCCTTFEPQPGSQLFAQRYDAAGGAIGDPLLVSETGGSGAAVAGDAAKAFMVVWNGADGDGGGVRGRRYVERMPQATGVLAPCQGSGDVWTFPVKAGQTIAVSADTLDAVAAADLCFHADCGTFAFGGDDEAACRFAPPSFACPRREMVAPADAACAVTVAACSAACADPARAPYALLVAVDGELAPLTSGGAVDNQTPTGTPKVTPTPTTHPPSEVRDLDIAVYRSLNDRVYALVLPVKGRRTQVTSLAIAPSEVRVFNEQFSPASLPLDLVVTSFAGTQGGSNLALTDLLRTEVVSGLTAHPLDAPPTFDPCANSGDGLLTFPSGQQVAFFGPAPNQPLAPQVVPIGAASPSTPGASMKRIVRRIGQELAMTEAIVFPAPPATCVGGGLAGTSCRSDAECGPNAVCGLTSRPPTCHGDANVICDPTQPSTCFLGGPCDSLGGETNGQSVTLDDTLDSPIGNPAAQTTGPDGFRLAGDCGEPGGCQVMAFMLDGAALDTVNVAAAGFLLDAADRVIGTAGGSGQIVAGLDCPRPREFRVHAETAGSQQAPALCQTTSGDAVVTWSGDGIQAQRFAGNGVPLDDVLTVNTSASGSQGAPVVCCGDDGGFVVAWSSSGDGDQTGVFARRFASSGEALGSEFQVNTYTTGSQGEPAITCLPQGDFLVAWTSGDVSGFNIAARYFVDGGPPSAEFRVDTVDRMVPRLRFPSVCSGPDGAATIAWTSDAYSSPFTTAMRRFAPGGAPLGDEAAFPGGSQVQFRPALACRPDGTFMLVHEVVLPCMPIPPNMCGADGSGDAIFIAGGARVNSSTLGNQRSPAVAADGSGNTLVVWTSDTRDGGTAGIFAQRFTSTGLPLGGEFQLNADTGVTQSEPAVSCDAAGNCVAAWTAPDDDGTGVFAQRIPP